MSEDAKRSGGAPAAKPTSDDRRISSGSVPSPTGTKVTIKSADMKPDVQKEAVDIAIAAFEKHNVEKDVAELIKKEFDKKYGPTWHCIVGKNFGDLLKENNELSRVQIRWRQKRDLVQ
ncbi:hypothetical protein KY289_001684 [Solanum tuberosum]|nr:hypothetical protein KY289_001684 [Solanum tuberosum]